MTVQDGIFFTFAIIFIKINFCEILLRVTTYYDYIMSTN